MHIRPRYYAVLLSLIGMSCQSTSSSTESDRPASSTTVSDASTPQPDSLCFRDILSRDTTTLQLVLTGDRASGQIDINPYEKDRARGSFTGTRSGNTITADWQRSGEGMTETYALTLTLSGDSISWGEGERIEQQGKWVLKQPGGTSRYRLAKIPCR